MKNRQEIRAFMAWLAGCRWLLSFLPVLTLSGAESALTQEPSPDATGTVILRWTAPGDDGHVGRAAGYQVRYQGAALGLLDTPSEWSAANSVVATPNPSPAGETDSIVISNLTPGESYYFALKAHDQELNYSEISNSPLRQASDLSCCSGKVGNVNGLGGDEPTISDIGTLVDHLFITQSTLWCATEADLNQSGGIDPQQGDGGDITIADASILIDHLFISGVPLRDCL